MAQDFEDITGQLIKRVVNITKTVENELAQLLRGQRAGRSARKTRAEAEDAPLMQGPSVPSVALDEDNVDDLLADFGILMDDMLRISSSRRWILRLMLKSTYCVSNAIRITRKH